MTSTPKVFNMPSMQYQIAMVGPPESVVAFKALGVQVVPCSDAAQVVTVLRALQAEMVTGPDGGEQPKYAVIFLNEGLAQAIPIAEYQELTANVLPALVPLPGPAGSTGFGAQRLGRIVERAIGSNILANN